jgi:hypothetical protein
MELVKGEFFEVSGINCSIENPSFVTAVISAAQFRFSRPCTQFIGSRYLERPKAPDPYIIIHGCCGAFLKQ